MMAMGGLMKVHNHHHHGNGNGSRSGKPYGLMILLAFGVAILGVMALHKVRERRVFNLLVKEKDTELTTLHLLLQKERDHTREAKWKVEEMRTKVSTLRAQKKGLDSRIQEMQSTISSLREEQRAIELALDERQNEIKLMRQGFTEASNDRHQVTTALSDTLTQKESEVEGSKNNLEGPPEKVWSVSTDDPSSANTDSQTLTSTTERDDTKAMREIQTSGEGVQEHAKSEGARGATELAERGSERVEIRNERSATQGEDTRKDGGETVDGRGRITEQTEKVIDPKEIVSGHGNGNLEGTNAEEGGENNNVSQTGEASGIQEEKNSQIQAVENHHGNEGSRFRNQIHEGYSTENEAVKTTEDGPRGRTSNSEGAGNQESGMRYQGGAKLEMSNHPRIGRSRVDAEGYLRKTKRKRLNKTHKTRRTIENSIRNGAVAAATSEGSFTEGTLRSDMNKIGYQGTIPRNDSHYMSLSVKNDSGSEDHESKIVDKEQESIEGGIEHGQQQEDLDMKNVETKMQESKDILPGIDLLRHDEDAQELSKDENTTTGMKMAKSETANDTSESTELHTTLMDMPTNTTLNEEDEMLSKAKQQHNKFEPDNQATSIQEPEEGLDAHKKDEVSEQTDPAKSDDEPENPQMEDATQMESETDASRESIFHSETDAFTQKQMPKAIMKNRRSQSFSRVLTV